MAEQSTWSRELGGRLPAERLALNAALREAERKAFCRAFQAGSPLEAILFALASASANSLARGAMRPILEDSLCDESPD